jgi:hypothetical protein
MWASCKIYSCSNSDSACLEHWEVLVSCSSLQQQLSDHQNLSSARLYLSVLVTAPTQPQQAQAAQPALALPDLALTWSKKWQVVTRTEEVVLGPVLLR